MAQGADIRVMTARLVRTLGALLLVGLLLVGQAPAYARGASPAPRVVIVVGPVGAMTDSYRRWAREGAAEARRWTSDVVEVYSPDATWPRVRAALQGASVVIYLGHGNGFPSPYGTKLRPAVQDGFGLNPVAGRGDFTHQYFGEGVVAQQVRLAPGAVVLLFHLCYASGLAEPGVPEGVEATARQRVDNYAAGFLAAGASAVVADAYASPVPYLRVLLGEGKSARTAWDRSPTANDNVRSFASDRTKGAVALMDPERASSGFERSLVLAAGSAGIVPAGPVPGASTPPGGWELVLPPQPSVAPDAFDLGAVPGTPSLAGMPLAASTVDLHLPVTVPPGVTLGSAYRLGTRWVPLDEAGVTADPVPGTDPAASPAPGETGEPALVARESGASLVDVVPATIAGGAVHGAVALPPATGRYRLEVTLHDAAGVALPYAVQASIPGVVVHVGGPGAAWLDAPPSLAVNASTHTSVQVVVTNGEASAWGGCAPEPRTLGPDVGAVCPTVRLVGRWVALEGTGTAAPMSLDLDVPAATARMTWLSGRVPAEPGTYLLVASLERSSGGRAPEVLGRPTTVTVLVTATPLVPAPTGDLVPTPTGDLVPTPTSIPLVPTPAGD